MTLKTKWNLYGEWYMYIYKTVFVFVQSCKINVSCKQEVLCSVYNGDDV